MEEAPFISVIVPVYNAEKTVRLLLDSLQQLEYPQSRREFIIVDNGSSDGTKTVVAQYPVLLLEETAVQSSYAARNRGLAKAQGDIIAFTDSDCMVGPEWLHEGVKALEESKADLVGGKVEFSISPGRTASEIFDASSHMGSKDLVSSGNGAPTANLFVRSTVVRRVGPFPNAVRSGGDMIWTRTAIAQGFVLAYAEKAVVRHPARRFRELLKKAFRVGSGAPLIARRNNESHRGYLQAALRSLLPGGFRSLRRRVESHVGKMETRPFVRVWLVSYAYGISWAGGVFLGYARFASVPESRHTGMTGGDHQ
jgi:glycosyltransferase involved in cell wall biosynthesis